MIPIVLSTTTVGSAIGSCAQQSTGLAGSLSTCAAQSNLAPIIIIAFLLDSAIIGIWYMVGYLLNSGRVKAGAKSEVVQLIGTAVIIAVILGMMALFAQTYGAATASTPLGSKSMNAICTNLANPTTGSQLDIFSGNMISPLYGGNSQGPYNFLDGWTGTTSSFPGLCSMVANPSTPTEQLDYPLAATSVVIANVTNQTLGNLNSLFVVDSFIGFLDFFSPQINICVPPPDTPQCWLPNPFGPILFGIQASYTPYAGYDFLYEAYAPLGDLLSLAFESYFAQFLFAMAMLFVWPYMLFIGIALRATPFTRKVGGMFIAIAVGAVILLPIVYGIEYSAMAGGIPQPSQATTFNSLNYGFSPVTKIPQLCEPGDSNCFTSPYISTSISGAVFSVTGTPSPCATPTSFKALTPSSDCFTNYSVNFFVTPKYDQIAQYYGCWHSDLIDAELADIGETLVPGANLVGGAIGAFGGSTPSAPISYPLIYGCTPAGGEGLLFAFFNAYGVTGVTAYFLPIINLLIVIAGIIGLSGTLGGDTELAGLAKLV